jgi:antitoxin component HigA of HigAB toxin-antitoxin module
MNARAPLFGLDHGVTAYEKASVLSGLDRALSSHYRAPEPQEVTEQEIADAKARYRTSMHDLDVAELLGCDPMVAAVVSGDRALIGDVAYTLVDKWTECLAMRDLCDTSVDYEAAAMQVVNNWVAARAAAIPAHVARAVGVVL